MVEGKMRFVDHGGTPEFFVDGLHTIEVRGGIVRFTLFTFRRTEEGEQIKEAVFTCIVPTDAVPAAIAMTLQALGPSVMVPAIKRVADDLLH